MSAATASPVSAPVPAPSISLPFDPFVFASVSDRLRIRLMSSERVPDVDSEYYSLHVGETDLRAVIAADVSGCSILPADAEGAHALMLPAIRDAWYEQGVSDDEVMSAAIAAESRRGYSVRPIWNVLSGLSGNPDPDPGDFPLYVVSTPDSTFSASGILLPYVCAQIHHRVGNPVFVLPSSIHEVLVLAADNAPEPAELAAMVQEINRTVVDDRDILSNHVYRLEYGKLSTVM